MLDYDTIEEQVTQAMLNLGTTPDKIAATLTTKGITGRRCSFSHCPIARYLTKELGCEVGVSDWVKIFLPPSFVLFRVMVELPEPIEKFVHKFDARKYPELIEYPEKSLILDAVQKV